MLKRITLTALLAAALLGMGIPAANAADGECRISCCVGEECICVDQWVDGIHIFVCLL